MIAMAVLDDSRVVRACRRTIDVCFAKGGLSPTLGALTLSVVALLAVTFRERIIRLMETRPHLLATVSRLPGALAGLVLVAIAVVEIASWATA